MNITITVICSNRAALIAFRSLEKIRPVVENTNSSCDSPAGSAITIEAKNKKHQPRVLESHCLPPGPLHHHPACQNEGLRETLPPSPWQPEEPAEGDAVMLVTGTGSLDCSLAWKNEPSSLMTTRLERPHPYTPKPNNLDQNYTGTGVIYTGIFPGVPE
jgi:hypothetical protein